jgi:hypothetical protein
VGCDGKKEIILVGSSAIVISSFIAKGTFPYAQAK